MANPIYATYTTTGAQDPVFLDHYIAPFSVTAAVWFDAVLGACTYALQWTLDDVLNPDPVSGVVWWDDPNLPSGTIVPGYTSYGLSGLVGPVRALRLNIDGLVGSVSLKIVQGFTIN